MVVDGALRHPARVPAGERWMKPNRVNNFTRRRWYAARTSQRNVLHLSAVLFDRVIL